ncbi:hypothetical protein GCM10027296_24950 [Chitinimonas naiadis]
MNFGAAGTVDNYNNPTALKLYSGYNFSDQYAVELGYGDFGSWKFTNPAGGKNPDAKISSNVFYVAGKQTWNLTDSFALFGKLGVARNYIETTGTNMEKSDHAVIRPMVGMGMDYKIANNLSAVLEYNWYGKNNTANGQFKQQKLETGLKFSF